MKTLLRITLIVAALTVPGLALAQAPSTPPAHHGHARPAHPAHPAPAHPTHPSGHAHHGSAHHAPTPPQSPTQ